MTDDQSKFERRDEFPASYRWQLAESFRNRSDQSANYLRGLLFALSAGSAGFIANHFETEPRLLHVVSISFFGIAIGLIIWSWDRQKTKSIERLKMLRDKGYDEYLVLEQFFAKYKKNEVIDRWSYAFIALGFICEVVARAMTLCR